MARTNVNDWNFMGDSLDASKSTKKKPLNLNGLSLVFLCSAAALIIFGAVSVYSSAIGTSENIFFNQLIYISAGIILFVIACLVPSEILKKMSPVFVLLTIGINVYFILENPLFLQNETSAFAVFVVTVLYYSSFFSNRENSVNSLNDLIAPIVVGVILTAILSVTSDYVCVALFILLLVVILGMYTLSFSAGLMLFMFVLIPAVCIVFSNPDHIENLLNYIVPGLSSENAAESLQLRRQCISSGSIFGKGLAMGCFKTSGIADIYSTNILCNICEETGLVGAGTMFLVYFVLFACSFMISSLLKNKNHFKANTVNGFTLIIMFKTLLNTAVVLGYFPASAISLPLISYGPQIVPEMFICGCIYKACLREKGKMEKASAPIPREVPGDIE